MDSTSGCHKKEDKKKKAYCAEHKNPRPQVTPHRTGPDTHPRKIGLPTAATAILFLHKSRTWHKSPNHGHKSHARGTGGACPARRTETHLHRARRLLAACPRVPFAPAADTPTAAMAAPPRATAVLAWCAHHSPAFSSVFSLARARPRRGELRFSRRRPTRRRADCSFSFSFCAGVPGRTGSWAWAGTRRRTGPTACRRWGPTPSPPSSPAAATPSPSATTAACVPFPFPDRCLLFVLVVHFLASFCF